jgi:DUF971 family protein
LNSHVPVPRRVEPQPGGTVGIAWSDGAEHFVPALAIRASCPCAECVDEMSGARRVAPGALPPGLELVAWNPVGAYAVALTWSDGHASGLFTHEHLRAIAEAAG